MCIRDSTGHTLEKIEADTDRDNFMTAEEAKSYNLVDHVVSRMDETGVGKTS